MHVAAGRMVRMSASVAVGALALCLVAGTASASTRAIKSRELSTERNSIKIALYEKWLPTEEANFKKNGKIILLVHGATWSSRCTFDPVPGYSLMDALADAGYDVYALDLHGYGKSGKSERDWTEAQDAVDDIDAAVDFIRAYRWVEKVHVFGYQWGAQPAALFAATKQHKVSKLVLFGMRYNSVEYRGAQPQNQYRSNSLQNASLKPDDGDLEPEFARLRAQVCFQNDPQSPNGALRDLGRKSAVDPRQVKNATLLIMGDRETDPTAMSDRLQFFESLGARNKWLVVLPGLGKYATYERGRGKFETALMSFLDQ